jgi:hypothetical protein
MTNWTACILALLGALPLAACDNFQPIEEEHLLRCLPEEDALLYLEIDQGIYAANPAEAADVLLAAVAGKRIFPASGGLFACDLEGELESTDDFDPELHRLLADVRVEDSGLYLDADGRLCFYRLAKFGHLRRMLEILNAWLNREYLAQSQEGGFEPEFPVLDAETAEAWQEAARKDHIWLKMDGHALLLDLPMSASSAARCLAWISGEESNADRNFAARIFEQATRLEISGGHARLWFGEEPRRTLRFASRNEAHSYVPNVLSELKARDAELGPPHASERARERVEGR